MALLVIGVLAERLVARVAVMFLEIVDDTSRKIVGDRRIQDDARVAIRIVAYFTMRDDFKVLGGISRQDVQGAAGRVAAEQRALRTTEHFDAFKIVEIGHALRRTGDINAVDIEERKRT